MSISVRFDGNGVPEVLAVAKREVKARMKEGMMTAAEETILPEVVMLAPTIIKGALTIKGRIAGPVVTTRGPRQFDRITGLLNFGGTVRTPLAPKDKSGHQALSLGPGLVRARVRKPRHYRGKRFIEKAMESAFPEFENRVLDEVMQSFDGIPHQP